MQKIQNYQSTYFFLSSPIYCDLDEYSDVGAHWIALYALNNNVTYFDTFGVEHIPKEIKKTYW